MPLTTLSVRDLLPSIRESQAMAYFEAGPPEGDPVLRHGVHLADRA